MKEKHSSVQTPEEDDQFKSLKKVHIDISYNTLIAILQGKEINLYSSDYHFIFHPPFKGVFLTYKQLSEVKYGEQKKAFDFIQKVSEYKEAIKIKEDKEYNSG